MPQAIQHRPPKEGISDLDATKSLYLETLNSRLDAALARIFEVSEGRTLGF